MVARTLSTTTTVLASAFFTTRMATAGLPSRNTAWRRSSVPRRTVPRSRMYRRAPSRPTTWREPMSGTEWNSAS